MKLKSLFFSTKTRMTTTYKPLKCLKSAETFSEYQKCVLQDNARRQRFMASQLDIKTRELGGAEFNFIKQTLDTELDDLVKTNFTDIKETMQGRIIMHYSTCYPIQGRNSFSCNDHCREMLSKYVLVKNNELQKHKFIQTSKLYWEPHPEILKTRNFVNFYLKL